MKAWKLLFPTLILLSPVLKSTEVEAGIFANGSTLVIRLKPTGGNFNAEVSAVLLGIKYPTVYGVTFSPPTNYTGVAMALDATVQWGSYTYMIYSWVGQTTLTMTQNVEYPLMQVTVSGGSGTGVFTLVGQEGLIGPFGVNNIYYDPNYYFESLAGVDNGYSEEIYNNTAQNVPLPVQLRSFTASLKGSDVLLKWTTATECNNYGFDVERSFDTSTWSKIGFVEGAGTSNVARHYEYTDHLSAVFRSAEIAAYRLRQIDRDGKSEYSGVLLVPLNAGKTVPVVCDLFPQPVDEAFRVSVSLPAVSTLYATIYDVTGTLRKELLAGTEFPPGYHIMNFHVADLPSGLYVLVWKIGDVVTMRPFTIAR
ncbi:MAG: hypothetical protein QHI48_04670 [Bacteroidota bacterium]|nr:hypothetical protein [Bacteroidota bacterium]